MKPSPYRIMVDPSISSVGISQTSKETFTITISVATCSTMNQGWDRVSSFSFRGQQATLTVLLHN